MRGIILAAGRGSRMGSLTKDRPKCLIVHRGARLLDRQLAALQQAGVDKTAVVTGWQCERFEELVPGLARFHNARWEHSSMVDSLACADSWLRHGPCVICYGDIVFTPEAVRRVAAAPAEIAVAYDPQWQRQWSRRFIDPLSDAETFRLGAHSRVTDIGGTPMSIGEVQGQYMGLLKLTPVGWSALKSSLLSADREHTRRDMTGLLRRITHEGAHPIRAVAAPGPWHEFDSRGDLHVGTQEIDELDRILWNTPRPKRQGHTPGTEL